MSQNRGLHRRTGQGLVPWYLMLVSRLRDASKTPVRVASRAASAAGGPRGDTDDKQVIWGACVSPKEHALGNGASSAHRSSPQKGWGTRIQRETPGGKPLAFLEWSGAVFVETSVKLQGASPWPLGAMASSFPT